MGKNTDFIKVALESDYPLFVPVYHTFLESKFLNGKEKIIFVILKKFLTIGTEEGQVFPKLETICEYAGMSRKTVIKIIKGLQKKGIVEVVQQGLNKPNLYTLKDYSNMWKAESIAKVKETADEIEERRMIEALIERGYRITKEKELETDSDQTSDSSTYTGNFSIGKDSTNEIKSQVERYTLNQIQQIFEYDTMINDNPYCKENIDSVMDILHSTMNTTKSTIRIAREDKPAMVVISKLMKLHKDSIMYAIKKFSEQTERIKNPAAYMLTILYSAPEQFNLDIENQVRHNMAHWENQD